VHARAHARAYTHTQADLEQPDDDVVADRISKIVLNLGLSLSLSLSLSNVFLSLALSLSYVFFLSLLCVSLLLSYAFFALSQYLVSRPSLSLYLLSGPPDHSSASLSPSLSSPPRPPTHPTLHPPPTYAFAVQFKCLFVYVVFYFIISTHVSDVCVLQ
jgi:hypothetical protein